MIIAIEDRVYSDDIRVLIITGSEEGRAFCAGADLKGMAQQRGIAEEDQAPRTRPWKRTPRDFNPDRIVMDLRNLPKPVIAMVNGIAVGAGFDISLWCDLRIASDQARFGQFYVRRGLLTDRGGTWFLPRLCGTVKAFEILTTGRWVDAEEAERIGIVNKMVPHSELRNYTYDLARQYAKLPPLSIGHMKFLMYENLHTSLKTGLALEHYAMGIAARSEDSKEGIRAWLKKREPTFQGK